MTSSAPIPTAFATATFASSRLTDLSLLTDVWQRPTLNLAFASVVGVVMVTPSNNGAIHSTNGN